MIKNELITSRMIKDVKELNRYYTNYNVDLDYSGNEFIRLNMIVISEIQTHDNKKYFELQKSHKLVYTPLNHDYSIDMKFLDFNIERSETVVTDKRYYSSLQALYQVLYNEYQFHQINKDNIHLHNDYMYIFDDKRTVKLMFDDLIHQMNNNFFKPFIVFHEWDIRHIDALEMLLYEVFEKKNVIINFEYDKPNNIYTTTYKILNFK